VGIKKMYGQSCIMMSDKNSRKRIIHTNRKADIFAQPMPLENDLSGIDINTRQIMILALK